MRQLDQMAYFKAVNILYAFKSGGHGTLCFKPFPRASLGEARVSLVPPASVLCYNGSSLLLSVTHPRSCVFVSEGRPGCEPSCNQITP